MNTLKLRLLKQTKKEQIQFPIFGKEDPVSEENLVDYSPGKMLTVLFNFKDYRLMCQHYGAKALRNSQTNLKGFFASFFNDAVEGQKFFPKGKVYRIFVSKIGNFKA